MVIYAIIIASLFSCLSLVSILIPTMRKYDVAYLILVFFSIGSIWILTTIVKTKSTVSVIMTYLLDTVLLVFGVYIGTSLGPNEPATAFCVLLIILPFTFYDVVIRTFCFRMLMCILFFRHL